MNYMHNSYGISGVRSRGIPLSYLKKCSLLKILLKYFSFILKLFFTLYEKFRIFFNCIKAHKQNSGASFEEPIAIRTWVLRQDMGLPQLWKLN